VPSTLRTAIRNESVLLGCCSSKNFHQRQRMTGAAIRLYTYDESAAYETLEAGGLFSDPHHRRTID